MIEHELATVPASEASHRRGETRKRETMGQDRIGIVQPESPIGAGDRDQCHGGHSVRPTRLSQPDTGHQQKFPSTNNAGADAGPEGEACRPETDPRPEGIARPPIEEINTKGGNHKRDWEMHHHHMDRVPNQRHCRPSVESEQLQHDRTFCCRVGTVFAFHYPSHPARPKQTLRRDHNVLAAAVYVGVALSLSDCTGPLSTLEPVGPASTSIANLWWVMLAAAAGLFALVMILFALVILRPGWGSDASPTRWIVLGGLCLPGIILTPMLAYALFVGEQLLPRSVAEPIRIQAVAHQWSWTFFYPGHDGIKTEGVLHLPVGVPVDVIVTSLDVIHAFWIPRLAGKIDAVPGHVNLLRIQADVPGRYQGLCNQFCGSGHPAMRFDVVVHPAADFYTTIAKPDPAGRVKQ